jgi:V8-like Glu-specific endopeptidase
VKKLLLFSFGCLFIATSYSQKKYWQQEVNFTIDVTLNDADHSLQAFETIEYINHSPDTIRFIWFHIWPNAYKNDRTAFSEQLLKNGRTDFYFSPQEDKGYINQLDFKVDGISTAYETQKNIDIIKLMLPAPLAPGHKAIIATPFHVKLPKYFSRSGHIKNDYQVTQWFPKPAVYDATGWHPMPYLDQGEFYSEFGDFDVNITAPSAYVVAATGILQDEKTLQEIKEKGKHIIDGNLKTWHYKQDKVHDFGWFASKDYIVKYDTAVLSSKTVDIFSYYKPNKEGWKNSVAFAKDGLKKYSEWIGDYPYTTASVVQGGSNETSGGMEYPTITLITTQEGGQELDATIVHEVGHNWFYGALANNERDHPWMDEGMNTYYQKRYEDEKYKRSANKKGLNKKLPADEEALLFQTYLKLKKDQPIEATSEAFSSINYDLIIYYKSPLWMKKLEKELGRQLFDSCMRNYYNEWKFKHPQPEDFKASIEKSSGRNLDELFTELKKTGPLEPANRKPVKLTALFNLSETNKYNYVSVAPAIGFNNYDKVMIGGLIHNYQLPLNRFHFIAGALYGTASQKLNGFGRVSYNTFKKAYHLETALSYISYSQDDFTKEDNRKLIQRLQRWVPSVKVTLYNKDATVTQRFTVQAKTFLLNEDALNFPTDTLNPITTIAKKSIINRLSFSVSDTRILYPYDLTFSADQGKNFMRTGLTAKYFFNYAEGKSGMSARLFAGKFFYLNRATSNMQLENERYFLNMTGPKGDEDYTYSDYFIGRNEYQNWMSQQIMERDGFFKVNTDLFNNKVGKTDDWLTSINLVADLPDNVNPLRVLPVKIPFKIFADVGTYSEAWKNNPATGRFIYDAGIQLSFIRRMVNIYIPVLYSKVYKDYYKTTITQNRFLKTLSFNIDLSQLQAKKLLGNIPF